MNESPAPLKELPVFTKSKNKPKPDHDPRRYGEIPGVPVGSTFPSRHACWKAGVHGHTQAGIHGSETAPAYSIVMSGRYADDCDQGDTFVYSGEGGRAKEVAGKNSWASDVQIRSGIEETRASSCLTRPGVQFRYDGLYRVTQVVYGDGKTGFKTCKFTFDRLPDQPPLPNEVLKPRKSRSRKATSMPRTLKPVVGLLRPGPSGSSTEDDADELESPTTTPVSLKRKRGEDGDNGHNPGQVAPLNNYGFTRTPFIKTASSSAAPPKPTLPGFVSTPIPPIVSVFAPHPGWVAPLNNYGFAHTPFVMTGSSSAAPPKPMLPGFGSTPRPPIVSVSAPGVRFAPKPTDPPPRLSKAIRALQAEYEHAKFDIMCKPGVAISQWEWGVLCLEYNCPGRLYTPCEGETMDKFRVHLLAYHVQNYPPTPHAESGRLVVPAVPPPTAFSPAALSLVSYPTSSPSTMPARALSLSSSTSTAVSSTTNELEERVVINWIKNTPSATTTAFAQYFARYMTDVGNRDKLFDIVRKVAQVCKVADATEGILEGILSLKEAYQGPQVK